MTGKEKTIKDYNERINKVLLFINNNLQEKLDLKTLSEISNFSSFHFHRIMRAHLNESLGSYIVRIRLDYAANLIKNTNKSISDIAYIVGYETPAAFTKAFRKRFSTSPVEFRNKKHLIKADGRYIYSPKTLSDMKLSPKFCNLKTKKLVYIQTIGKYGEPATGEAWDRIWKYIKKNKLFSWKMEGIGICHDNPDITESEKCRYDACITVKREIKPEDEVGYKEILGGKYAMFKMKGSYEQFDEFYDAIYSKWLASSGYELRNVPAFEKYLNDPNKVKPEKLITEIYIPIE